MLRCVAAAHVPAFAESLGEPFLSVALTLLVPFDSHVKGTKVVLQLEIDGPLCRWKVDLLNVFRERNFVYLGDILG